MTYRAIATIGKIGLETAYKPIKGVRLPDLTPRGIEKLELMPDELREMAELIGDARAKRAWALLRRGIIASLPELCAYDWLERRRHNFIFQSVQMGGKQISGGSVVDFIVFGLAAGGCYIWRVMGEYWHKGAEQKMKDLMQKIRLKRVKINSSPVVEVVDLWELDIYNRYPTVFERAEYGQELRPWNA